MSSHETIVQYIKIFLGVAFIVFFITWALTVVNLLQIISTKYEMHSMPAERQNDPRCHVFAGEDYGLVVPNDLPPGVDGYYPR